MKRRDFNLTLSVSDFLKLHPEAIPVFVKLRLACVGCAMAAFDTVKDVIRIYSLDERDLLARLREAVRRKKA